MNSADLTVDFLVVGSGAGGMAAAVTAAHLGMDTLVIEKDVKYGGTSALSGGVIWVPNNHQMARAGISDSEDDAMRYLDQVVSADVPREKLRKYVQEAPKMLKFLEQHSLVKFAPAPEYPDYYAELEGGKLGARSLDPKPYSIRKLGVDLLRQMNPGPLKIRNRFSMTAAEAHEIFSFSWRSGFTIFKRLFIYWLDLPARLRKLPDNRLTLGKALVSRLRHSLQRAQVPLWLNARAVEIITEENRVTGLVVACDGRRQVIAVRKGLLLAAGGFAQCAELRPQYQPQVPAGQWSAANHTDTGDGIKLGRAAGGQIGMMHCAWWTPSMVMPNQVVEALIVGKSFPGSIVVDQAGERFCNEAEPYEDFVKHQFQANAVPAWLIFDARYRQEYPLGTALVPKKYLPDEAYKPLFESGWIKKAPTLAALAETCSIDQAGLLRTAEKIARFARQGHDEDFGRGGCANDVYYSDHRIKPNPCLSALEAGPFYAIKLWPGDLGTKGGLITDTNGQVLDTDNQPIAGLYACGNTAASVMGDSYPGAGSTLGPAMTFGYIAAKHAAGDRT